MSPSLVTLRPPPRACPRGMAAPDALARIIAVCLRAATVTSPKQCTGVFYSRSTPLVTTPVARVRPAARPDGARSQQRGGADDGRGTPGHRPPLEAPCCGAFVAGPGRWLRSAAVRMQRDPDARGQEDVAVVDPEGGRHHRAQLAGEHARVLRAGERLDQRGEAARAQPGQRVGLAEAGLETGRHRAQQAVAERAAHLLDHAEIVVELDRQQRQMPVLALGARDRALEALLEERLVGAGRSARRGARSGPCAAPAACARSRRGSRAASRPARPGSSARTPARRRGSPRARTARPRRRSRCRPRSRRPAPAPARSRPWRARSNPAASGRAARHRSAAPRAAAAASLSRSTWVSSKAPFLPSSSAAIRASTGLSSTSKTLIAASVITSTSSAANSRPVATGSTPGRSGLNHCVRIRSFTGFG